MDTKFTEMFPVCSLLCTPRELYLLRTSANSDCEAVENLMMLLVPLTWSSPITSSLKILHPSFRQMVKREHFSDNHSWQLVSQGGDRAGGNQERRWHWALPLGLLAEKAPYSFSLGRRGLFEGPSGDFRWDVSSSCSSASLFTLWIHLSTSFCFVCLFWVLFCFVSVESLSLLQASLWTAASCQIFCLWSFVYYQMTKDLLHVVYYLHSSKCNWSFLFFLPISMAYLFVVIWKLLLFLYFIIITSL